jgi:hypothetical protein
VILAKKIAVCVTVPNGRVQVGRESAERIPISTGPPTAIERERLEKRDRTLRSGLVILREGVNGKSPTAPLGERHRRCVLQEDVPRPALSHTKRA